MVYPKHITAWMCALISTDGHISPPNKSKTRRRTADICLVTTSEKEWADNICQTLAEYDVVTSVVRHTQTSRFSRIIDSWKVQLCKRNPKGKHSGINQHKKLLDSIKRWTLEPFMIQRKLDILATL